MPSSTEVLQQHLLHKPEYALNCCTLDLVPLRVERVVAEAQVSVRYPKLGCHKKIGVLQLADNGFQLVSCDDARVFLRDSPDRVLVSCGCQDRSNILGSVAGLGKRNTSKLD